MVKLRVSIPGILFVLVVLSACSGEDSRQVLLDSGTDTDGEDAILQDQLDDLGIVDADDQDPTVDGMPEDTSGSDISEDCLHCPDVMDGSPDEETDRDPPFGDAGLDHDLEGPAEPGAYTVQIPSVAGGDEGIAVRVFHPALSAVRYPEVVDDDHPSAITTAAILELCDRAYLGDTTGDLTEVLWPPH